MKILVSLLFTSFMLCLPEVLFGQKVLFSYDVAGNRISRIIEPEDQLKETISSIDTILYFNTAVVQSLALDSTYDHVNCKVKVFPNPTKGKFKIMVDGWRKEIRMDMDVSSLDSRSILTSKIHSSVTDVDLTHLPAGPYILTILTKGEKVFWKIIKK